MAKVHISTKRLQIDKANTQMVIILAVASFVSVLALVVAQALWGQGVYQKHIIDAKRKAANQLKDNIKTVNQLDASYQAFVSVPQNVIGGNPSGKGSNDGDNAKIILDALPSQYDFPALTSSLEKILDKQHLKIDAITGTDDEVAQQSNSSSTDPQPINMPFSFTVSNADYPSIQKLIKTLQLSIRPFVIDTMTISGGESNMQLVVNAHTYYQPEKDLNIRTEVIK